MSLLLVGLSIGAELDLLSFFCARYFGLRRYSAIYGGLAMFFYTGIAAGGLAYGRVHDLTGSYRGALMMTAVLLLASSMMFFSLGLAEPVQAA